MRPQHASFLRREWLQILLAVLPLAAALAAMPYASHKVPMQWNLQGQVTWYAPKSWGLLVMPVTAILTLGLVMWMERRDPARQRDAGGGLTAHGKATRLLRLGIGVLLAAVTLAQIFAALGHQASLSRFVVSGVALLFAFMGNLFGKLKPNRYVGIRVPWTLNSEHVWRQTHRFAGWVWTVSSLIVAVLCWLLPVRTVHQQVTWIWMFFLIAVPLLTAWHEARKERSGKPAA